MNNVAEHTSADISKATQEAFVDQTTSMRPAINNTLTEKPAAAATPILVEKTAEQILAETEEVKVAAAQQVQPAASSFDDISDEDFNKLLEKRSKGKIKSLDDLKPEVKKTKEELEAEEEQEKVAALEWKLSTGEIKRSDYDNAILEKGKDNREIALSLFATEMKEIDAALSESDILELFKDHYREDMDDADPKRKIRLKEMNQLANNYKKEKTGFLDNIDSEYKGFRSQEKNKEILGAQLDAVFEAVPADIKVKSTYKNAEGKDAEIEVSYAIEDADFKAIKKEARKNMVSMLSQLNVNPKDVKDEDINREINSILRGRVFDKVMTHIAKESAERGMRDAEVIYKNIPVRTQSFASADSSATGASRVRVFTPEEKQAMHGAHN